MRKFKRSLQPKMHTPYHIKLSQNADFKVRYRFLDKQESGRQFLPFQGYRSDFYYDHEGGQNQVFMIWPEFEDEKGNIILDTSKPVLKEGIASMWILIPKMRSYHKEKIKIGLKGFFREGSRNTAECEVIEIVDLLINPTEPLTVNGKIYL